MKRLLLSAALLTVLSPAAFAQGAPPPGSPPPPPGAGSPPSGDRGEHFAERKAHIIAEMQSRLACVQAAQDRAAVEACRPKRPEHGGPGHEPSPGSFPGDK